MKRSYAHTNSQPPLQQKRRAFSLIELLVVMVVIAILAGFLLPAIGRVRRTARLNEVKTEMTRFGAAIAAFKARYGVEPPSAIVLPNVANSMDWDPISRRRIRAIWPQFNFATVGGIPAAYFDSDGPGGAAPKDFVVLTGAECLAFFLGGMPQNGSVGGVPIPGVAPLLTGFSKNPRTPFAIAGSNRDGPFYEFKAARLLDVDNDLFVEYADSLPGQTVPLLYVSSNNGKGYPTQVPGGIDDFDVFNANDAADPDSNNIAELYNNTLGTITDSGFVVGNLVGVYQQGVAGPWKKQSYQIISAGEDFQWGAPNATTAPWSAYAGKAVYTDADSVKGAETDNLTNFNDGLTLGE